jgi:hypothetical protein
MTFDGSFAWYDHTENATSSCSEQSKKAGKDGCHLFDVNGGKCAAACQQSQPEWCWATAASEIATRIDYSLNRYSCSDLECQVSGRQQYPSNPQQCCENTTMRVACGSYEGYNMDIAQGIKYLLKRNINWDYYPKESLSVTMDTPSREPISEHRLKCFLNKGYSITMSIRWNFGNHDRHVLTLTGTDNNGNFYVHDPLSGTTGHYQHLRFGQLLIYQPPYSVDRWGNRWTQGANGTWTDGMIIKEGGRFAAGNHTQC